MTSIIVTFFLFMMRTASSVGQAGRGLRAKPIDEQQGKVETTMTFRITVFDDLVSQEDERITNVEHIMAIPIEEGVESANFYSMEDLSEEIVTRYNDSIQRGNLFLTVTGGGVRIDGTNSKVTLTDDTTIRVLEESPLSPSPSRNLKHSQTRRVVVIRVSVASGPPEMRQVAYSAKQIHKHMFENDVSLKKQIERCSGGSITIQPGGVHEITIPGQASDYTSPSGLRNTALQMMSEKWGVRSVKERADHVIVILPPGPFGGFIGNAGVDHWLSTLNNLWSLDVMVFMHEMGHNFGLNHAFLTDRSFDFSSYMSATGIEPNLNGPLKCFNAASNRQMGFFGGRTEMINLNRPIQSVTLAAFSEAQKSNDRDPVILKVGQYSLQYNFASEFNSGTEILRNQVTVAHSAPGKTIVEKDGLVPNGPIFTVNDLGGTGKTLRIEACEEITGNEKTPNSVTMAISMGIPGSPCDYFRRTSTPTLPPTDPPTPSPTTPCPDTSRVIVHYIGDGRKQKHKSLRCGWIAEKPCRRHHFCNNKLQGWEKRRGREERVRDICQQECGTCCDRM